MIRGAALLVLAGLGLFVAGRLTGAPAYYWACVGVCAVAALLLVVARRAPADGADVRPASGRRRAGGRGSAHRAAPTGRSVHAARLPGRTAAPVQAAAPVPPGEAVPEHLVLEQPVPEQPVPEQPVPDHPQHAEHAVPEDAGPQFARPMSAGPQLAGSLAVPEDDGRGAPGPGADERPRVHRSATAGARAWAAAARSRQRGAHAASEAPAGRPPARAGEPGVEEVEVTDLLLVVDLTDEVLVVDEHPRYHLAGCPHLTGRETFPLPLDEARTDGFTPCAVCTPDRHLAERERARKAGRAG